MTDIEIFRARKRNESIEWAREVLAHPDDYVIFDTETSGLGYYDVIIHFAVMGLDEKMLIDTKVKPLSITEIEPEATAVNGIKMEDLATAPLFWEVVEMFRPIAASKKILSYAAPWHSEMFDQTFLHESVSSEPIRIIGYDVKHYFERFINRDGIGLPDRKNTGKGDCRATLSVIRRMAAGELVDLPPESPPSITGMDDGTMWMVGLLLTGVGLGALTNKWGWGFVIILIGVLIYMGTPRKADRN